MTTIEAILRNNQYIEKYLKFMTFFTSETFTGEGFNF